MNEVEIEIYNHAYYNLTPNSVKELVITLNDEAYRYQTLEQLLHEKEAISEHLELLKNSRKRHARLLKLLKKSVRGNFRKKKLKKLVFLLKH